MQQEPNRLEMLLTRAAFLLCGKSVYAAFADRLPLDGGEHVLDFGCGMGTVAYYAVKKLPHGQLACLDISKRWLKACRKTLHGYTNIVFLQPECLTLYENNFDVAYCHFVLHDLTQAELERSIPTLSQSLKPGGMLVFREPLREAKILGEIKRQIQRCGLTLKDSRVTDIPLMGNALESIYLKQ